MKKNWAKVQCEGCMCVFLWKRTLLRNSKNKLTTSLNLSNKRTKQPRSSAARLYLEAFPRVVHCRSCSPPPRRRRWCRFCSSDYWRSTSFWFSLLSSSVATTSRTRPESSCCCGSLAWFRPGLTRWSTSCSRPIFVKIANLTWWIYQPRFLGLVPGLMFGVWIVCFINASTLLQHVWEFFHLSRNLRQR